MGKTTNILLTANSEVFGFPTEIGIANMKGEILIAGSLNTKGKSPNDFIQNKELNISDLAGNLTLLPKPGIDFSIHFAKKADKHAFVLTSSGIICGMMFTSESKQLLLVLRTEELKNGNAFERSIADVAGWAGISNLCLIAQNQGNNQSLLLVKQLLGELATTVDIPRGYEKFQLMAIGVFDLNDTTFGKGIKDLTKLNKLTFAVGGNFSDSSFGAMLLSERIDTPDLTIENLSFGMQKSGSGFSLIAGGTFILKLESGHLGFSLYGSVSGTSFMLSASSLPGVRIPLNSRLSFSDLGLSVGINNGMPSFGMIGRLNTNNLSLFAGFVITPPSITLFTSAVTSTTGRLSLKDLVVEIADIQSDLIDCLDVIAVGDFDLTDTSLSAGISNFPENNREDDYERKKSEAEQKVISEFNQKIEHPLQIAGEAQLMPLGNNSGQFILTDKGTMRHYRIDRNGRISLNCQIYVCMQPTRLGNYDMPPGFFICGTLEIFGVKARFLFLVDKGKSLVALVQIQKIEIHGIFLLDKSEKVLPIEPINGGLAGQLVKPDNDGPVLFLSIQRDKGELTFYLSAHVTILNIFKFDALVLIKERFIFINIEHEWFGFKTTFYLKAAYNGLTDAGFEARITFDTSGFLEIMKKAQEALKGAAKAVQSGVVEATRKLDDAQRSVLDLQWKINNFNSRIDQCIREINESRWYQFWIKIARGLEIVGLEIAKAGVYVAIGVAYGVLEIAKAVLQLGGAIVSTVLEALAFVIDTITQVLWIKSFELGITATPQVQNVSAKLVLTVFGNDVVLPGMLDLNSLIDSVKGFVSGSVTHKSDELIQDIKEGKVHRALEANDVMDAAFVSEYGDFAKNKERYAELLSLRNAADDLFIDSNNAYFDAFNEENPTARESACRLTEVRWEEEVFKGQHENAFDTKFAKSLDTVIQTIRQEKKVNRADVSDEFDKSMDDLLFTVKSLNKEKKAQAKRAANRESLFTRLEKNIDVKRSSCRTRAADAEISAKEANERYAEDISRLIDKHLGDKTGEVAEDLRKRLGIALYQFRNPDDTFRKQNNVNNEDDEEDF